MAFSIINQDEDIEESLQGVEWQCRFMLFAFYGFSQLADVYSIRKREVGVVFYELNWAVDTPYFQCNKRNNTGKLYRRSVGRHQRSWGLQKSPWVSQ